EAEARAVATGIALKQIYKKYGVKHAISFHTSIRAADRFREQQDVLNCLQPQAENFHISSHKSAGERKLLLDEFKRSPRALMTNARCLTEGIDVPAIDCVVFADPKQSTTDVVQASGRAMRNAKGKKCGYIVVPIVVPEGMEFNEFAETTAFRTVVRIITALSVHDTRIVDELRAMHYGHVPSGKIIEIEGNVPVGMHMSLDRFAEAIGDWLGTGNRNRGNWRNFKEARAFVQNLGFKSGKDWHAYCRSGQRPDDIPANPNVVYADSGWVGMSDWLGNGRRIGDWQNFEEAKAFVQNLGLSPGKSRTTFQQVPMRFMPIPVGSIGAIGSEPADAYAIGGTLRRPGLSCKTSDSSRESHGSHIAVPGKSRMILQWHPIRFMPNPVGTVGTIGSERTIAIGAIGVTLRRP